ncbi:MAG TPA: 50S ribosomal protein L30 [Acidobacteriota bacterium]
MAKASKKSNKLRIRQVRSGIGFARHQKRVLAGLGLKHPHDEVEREDSPELRGMVAKIPHLVEIVEER